MIPFSPPHINQETIDEVVDTLKSGWITTGPKTKLFEKKITAYCENKSTLCLNSATAGLEIMLRWFGVKEGDEVIIPAYTYGATANVIIHCRAKPIFIDIGDDFNINENKIKEAITSRTKVIIPVDFAGYPCNYDELNSIVNLPEIKSKFDAENDIQKKLGRILILSDAAHSFGAKYNGKKTGSLTDVSVFSFHAVKNLTTAEGGAVALNLPEPFNNNEIYKQLCIKTLHGQNKDALAKTLSGNWRYDIVEPGYNMCMTDISASLGLVQLNQYDDALKKRKEIFDSYSKALAMFDWAEIPVYHSSKKETSYHIYALRIKHATEKQRDDIIDKISEKNVSVNVHYIPLPLMTFYKNMGYKMSNYPNAFAQYQNEISLPVYINLTTENIKTIVDAVIKSVKEIMEQTA